ncbi:MAG: IS256 family transposase [Candidatus Omnitrophica bacterium]|nr:IS256 family transposase [Candidatus Omnitrophota bacterium]
MDYEITNHINATRHQRTELRLDYRNGYYYRNLDTELGPIDDLKIPRRRLGLFKTKVFELYQRRQKAVNEAICNVFLSGVSTRDVSAAIKPLLETTFSASCVSRITKNLNSKVKEFHKRKLLDEYQFLFLDGITLSVKSSLKAVKKLVLVAYGITIFGKKDLISFRIASSESQSSWEAFLNDLYTRGLKGDNLKLIITDGCKGLHAALDIVYAYTKRQHCWVHKLRNVAKTLRKSDEKQVLSEAKKIYKAKTKREAVRLFRLWKNHWYKLYPKAVNCIEKDLDELLSFLEIPIPEKYKALIRKRIRTTNVIERSFREVRRRIRPMSCFTNQDSVNRIIYAIFTRLNNKWEDKPLVEFTQFI